MSLREAAGRAGWDCGSCRQQGLERSRRCGFLAEEARPAPRIVWGRGPVCAEECPKSFVTGESLSMLEEFFVRQALGAALPVSAPARVVDAFLILREEMEREGRNGTQY
jgi:hypothetical protein